MSAGSIQLQHRYLLTLSVNGNNLAAGAYRDRMRRLTRRIRMLFSLMAIGFGVLFGKSGSWAIARYSQLAMPLDLDSTAAAGNATVTIVMPAYNDATRIASTIECLKAQTYPLFRALVVDDGSTDSTAATAVTAIADDARFTVMRLRNNAGTPSARNAGLAVTETEFVLFLDSDDFLLPTALASRVEYLRNDPTAAGSFGHAGHVLDGVDWRKQKVKTIEQAGPRLTLTSVDGESPFVIHQVLMRTQAALDIGGFDESFDRGCEDPEFWLRSLRSGYEYVDTLARDCLYVQRSGSLVESTLDHHVDLYMGLISANLLGESPLPAVTSAKCVDGPLPDLTAAAVLQKRAFKFLGMLASATAPTDQLPTELANALGAPRVISDETAIAEMRLGAGRSLRRAGSQNPRLLDEVVAAAAYKHRDQLVGSFSPEVIAREDEPSWAILVCDEHQASMVNEALPGMVESTRPMIITCASIAHDSGGARASDDVGKWPKTSTIRYLMLGYAYDSVLVGEHDCPAVQLVIRAATSRGSELIRWSNSGGAGPDLLVELASVAGRSNHCIDRVRVASPACSPNPLVYSSPETAV